MTTLLIGLGNPGEEYQTTRHNAGFWLLDAVADQHDVRFSAKRKLQAKVAAVQGCQLIKPQTFMNNSGISVAAAVAFYGAALDDIVIVHDEVDIAVGRIKLKYGGGTAGHNGLSDITQRLGASQYWRMRIGVGKPPVGGVRQYVLQTPPPTEREAINDAMEKIPGVWRELIGGNYNHVMQTLHSEHTA